MHAFIKARPTQTASMTFINWITVSSPAVHVHQSVGLLGRCMGGVYWAAFETARHSSTLLCVVFTAILVHLYDWMCFVWAIPYRPTDHPQRQTADSGLYCIVLSWLADCIERVIELLPAACPRHSSVTVGGFVKKHINSPASQRCCDIV